MTPLQTATSPELQIVLLEAGADPNVADKDKNAFLHTTDSSELMRALLTAGANFKQKNQASGPF